MHNHFNGLKTAALFGAIWALLLGLGALIGGGRFIWLFALIGVATTVYGYWNSDKLAIRAMHAYPVSEAQAPACTASSASCPRPRASRCRGSTSPRRRRPTPSRRRNPQNAAVCCTEGILGLLDERELRGVLGHELMHVYNRDILTSSVAAAIAGVITSIGQMLMFTSMFGGGSDENRPNPLALLAMRCSPRMAAMMIQLAISRTREYDADEDGARLTGDPLALASALRKLEVGVARAPLAPSSRSSTRAT